MLSQTLPSDVVSHISLSQFSLYGEIVEDPKHVKNYDLSNHYDITKHYDLGKQVDVLDNNNSICI